MKSSRLAKKVLSSSSIRLLISLLLAVPVVSCGGGSRPSGVAATVQPVNHAPVASGGADQTVYLGTSTATLDGSQSSDADSDAITYKWSIVGGPLSGASLANETTAHPSLTATIPGVYTVRLIVNDGQVSSTPDDVSVLFAEGVLLQGDSSALVKDLVVDMAPVGVGPDQVQDGIILTRLDLVLDPAATVGQLNAALVHVQGSIVTMMHTLPAVTIAIPPPADADALDAVAATLNGMPGVLLASIAHVPGQKKLPPSPAGDQNNLTQLEQLIPARFPAAWNASLLATNGFNNETPCAARKVSVLIADVFQGTLVGAGELQLGTETNTFPIIGSPAPASNLHGYEVAATLAAQFDSANPTGADPFTDCLALNGVQLSNLSHLQVIARIDASFPAGRFLLNFSQGYSDQLDCLPSNCTTAIVRRELDSAITRAYDTLDWKALTASRWDDFLIGVAAGNERALQASSIYPGLGVSVADSFMSIATIDDPLLSAFVSDASLWAPKNPPVPSGFPLLLTDSFGVSFLKRYATGLGADHIGPAGNVLMVGAGTAGFTSLDVAEAEFSDSSPDVFAVGSAIVMPTETIDGTSLSAPQVTGLASYLWLLSSGAKAHIPTFNDLNDLPSSVTRQAILANTRPGTGVNLIDAYATILSMDLGQIPALDTAPIRLALLDLNNDGKFDQGDVAAFLAVYLDGSGAPVEPTTRDYSRFDLNGDGFTGGSTTEQFDLDRVGSTQYGAARYDRSVSQQIEGSLISFDETQVTDLQILCYYAYSALYQGDTAARKNLLEGHCGSTVGFPGTERISTAIQALDAAGNQVVPTQFASSDSTETPIAPPSVGLHATGTYTQTPGTFNPVHFDVSGSSTASSVDTLIAPVGTFNGTVSCAASAPNTQDGVSAMPSLSSSTVGNLFINLPASRTIKFQVNASLARGEKIGSESRISGFIEVEYVDLTTGLETNPTIRIDDNSPAAVNFTVAQPSHGLIISWSIDALCQQLPAPGGLEEARSASFAISYSVVEE